MNNLSRRDFLKLPAIITLVTLFGFVTNIITILLGQEFGRIGPFKDFLEELNTKDPIIKSKAYRTIADIIAVSPRLKADGIYIAVSRYYSQQLVAPYAGESTLEIARQAFENQGTLITYISFIFKDGFENGSKSITVYEKIYPLVLPDTNALYNWVSGTALIPYLEKLGTPEKETFVNEYRNRLRKNFHQTPVFYPFKRIIIEATF